MMNFSKLNDLREHFSMDYLIVFDKYLSNLQNYYADKIHTGSIVNRLNIPYIVANGLLEKSCDLGILTKRYAIQCPECESVLRFIDDKTELIEVMKEINYCDFCEFEDKDLDVEVTNDDILILYKLNR